MCVVRRWLVRRPQHGSRVAALYGRGVRAVERRIARRRIRRIEAHVVAAADADECCSERSIDESAEYDRCSAKSIEARSNEGDGSRSVERRNTNG